jgi:dTDP-4-dehydrorhamnose 3,5-epimerase
VALEFVQTTLPGIIMIKSVVFQDPRGFFMETFHQEKYREGGIDGVFVQDNFSHSQKNTLRGLHYQLRYPQGKLIYALRGEIFDVVVDIRQGSPTFGKWESFILSGENRYQLFVPEGYAHGFCILSDTADVVYKCTDFYAPNDDFGVLWSDPTIGIDWPVKEPLLSEKDTKYPVLDDMPEESLPVFKP